MRMRLSHLVGCGLAALVLGVVGSARADIPSFLPPVPPQWSLNLDLPRPATSGETNESSSADAPRRALRDRAIRAFAEQRYAMALADLDLLAQDIALTSPLGRARAWSATYLGDDARAHELWSDLVASGVTDRDTLFMAAWHGIRIGAYRDAIGAAQRILVADPSDRDAHLMAALAAWGGGRPSAAERHLVASIRLPDPRAESFLAMAAILAQDGALHEGLGWLRRGLARLPAADRRAWLARAEFAPLAALDELWQRILAEADSAAICGGEPSEAPPEPAEALVKRAVLREDGGHGEEALAACRGRDEQQRKILGRLNITPVDDSIRIDEPVAVEQP